MKIRDFKSGDEPALWTLFSQSVRHVSIADYTESQVQAWAPATVDIYGRDRWWSKMALIKPCLAEIDGVIVGYASVDHDGYIDHFFCHHLYQRQGIGRSLFGHLQHIAIQGQCRRLFTQSSITAKPFFESQGFVVLEHQRVSIRGEVLDNFKMEKLL